MSGTIRVIVFEEAGAFVAQCLEYDICAQGSSIEEMRDNLRLTLNAEAAESLKLHGRRFAGIEAAPSFFEEAWNADGAPLAGSSGSIASEGWDAQVNMKLVA